MKSRLFWLTRVGAPPLIGLIFFLPFAYLLTQSLQQPKVAPQDIFRVIPQTLYFSNYLDLFERYSILPHFRNSLYVEALAVPLTLLTASLAGFAISQVRDPYRQYLVLGTAVLMLVPLPALWVPRYILYAILGWYDQIPTLAAPALMGSNPFFVLIFYWTFRRLPNGLIEAARLDGASLFGAWWRIALPLAIPSLIVVGVLTFTLYWNDYISPLMYLRTITNYPMSLRLQLFQGGDETYLPIQMAGVVVTIAPVILLFLAVQHYFWPEGRGRR
jgi:multiple sugar transport system permease protein